MASPERWRSLRPCGKLLLTVPPSKVGMLRFLLEARDNLAAFTCLDRGEGLLKLIFAPESRAEVLSALAEIQKSIPIEWRDWPCLD